MLNLAVVSQIAASYSYTTDDAVASGIMASFGVAYYIVMIVIAVLEIIGMWKIFEKAGLPGWYAIIPYFNLYWLFKISWGNGWLFLLCLVCGIGYIMLPFKLAPAYGKGIGFAFGLLLLGPIFYIIMGFDSSTYQGPQ